MDLCFSVQSHSFLVPVVSETVILLGCISWTFKKGQEKTIDQNFTRILHDISKRTNVLKSPTDSPISPTIQIRRSIQVENFWRNKDEIISNNLQWYFNRYSTVEGLAKTKWPFFCRRWMSSSRRASIYKI